MVIFIPYLASDAPRLSLSAAALRQFVDQGPHSVIAVGPPPSPELSLELAQAGVQHRDDSTVIPGLTRDRMPVIPHGDRDWAARYFQLLLHWALAAHVSEPLYMVVDPNLFLISPLKPIAGNCLNLPLEGDVPVPALLRTACALLGQHRFVGAYSRHYCVYQKTIVENLFAHIAKPRQWQRFYESILDCIDLDVPDSFCPCNTYAWFATLAFPRNVQNVPFSAQVVPDERAASQRQIAAEARDRQAHAIFYQSDLSAISAEPPANAEAANPVAPAPVSLSTLGRNGRFGNQLFQYAFLRFIASHHGLIPQTPPWIGQRLFALADSPVTGSFPPICEGHDFPDATFPSALLQNPPAHRDLWGFFQFHTSHYAPQKERFRSWFTTAPDLATPLSQALARFGVPGRPLVALHIRRGDYETEKSRMFFPAPTQWYLTWLEELWPTLQNPCLYIASDEPQKVLGDFRKFRPMTAADLPVQLPDAPFFPDFFALSQADYLAISNSSFSFFPALLNIRAAHFMRPHLHQQKLIPFDPWNSDPLLHRELAGPIFPKSSTSAEQTSGKGIQVLGKTNTGAPIISFNRPKPP